MDIDYMSGICLIYKYTCKTNDKCYVGQTWVGLEKRAGKNGSKYEECPLFYSAIQKHGWENFASKIVCLTTSQNDANFWEDHFIEKFDSTNPEKGYNLKRGGSNGAFSNIAKKKVSNGLKGKKQSIDHILQKSGENQSQSKLTEKEVIAIRHDNRHHQIIASEYNITRKYVSEIQTGKSWKHLPYGNVIIHDAQSGEYNGHAKLSKNDIIGIRADNRQQKYIAKDYNILQSTVSSIKLRKTWDHIISDDPIINHSHGETHPNTKLSNDDIIAIRLDAREQKIIAIDYGITQSTVSKIQLNQSWKHIK